MILSHRARHRRATRGGPSERKSIGAEDTFAIDIFDFEKARQELEPLAAKVWRHCEARSLAGRTVILKVKYEDFQQITRSRTRDVMITSLADLQQLAEGLLVPLFPTEKGIRLIGVTVSSLEVLSAAQDADGQLPLLRGIPVTPIVVTATPGGRLWPTACFRRTGDQNPRLSRRTTSGWKRGYGRRRESACPWPPRHTWEPNRSRCGSRRRS
ncbi:DinB/UmuC family translesion DNA polymerase [Azorhizobium oxalatiphilum]|uniref:DinB/UmuC family translesion DNA polymerase n=1 Tax=Azorhizobium oxalatiphilum TaxID=980631 RepID=UPI001FCE8B31|nr:hypothetical protein [Azorhizobium oxalatiphilum]